MPQFAKYANYYDDMYSNKPYDSEVDKIETFIKENSKVPVKTILSLGCGTGTYEILLAKRGYTIHGIDLSEDMLNKARVKISEAGVGDKITLQQGNMEDVKIDGKFDAAIMMFNIIGYVHSKESLVKVVRNVSNAVKTGSLFIFDCWNEKSVIADPPSDRTKIVEKDGKKITRITSGSLDLENKLVKIKFDVIEEENGIKKQEVVEDHPMRYWSKSELESCLQDGGLSLVKMTSFVNPTEPANDKEWDMFVVAIK